jgi:hypothetical protein
MPRLARTDGRVFTVTAEFVGGPTEIFICDSEEAARLVCINLIAEHSGDVVATWQEIGAWIMAPGDLGLSIDHRNVWTAEYSAVEELGHASDVHSEQGPQELRSREDDD